jgi:Domain of unknown function (DUF4296)
VKGLITFGSRFFALIFGFSMLVCCGKPESKKPDYILSQEQMVEALTEVYIAEQKITRLSLQADSAFLVFGSMEKKIFNDLNVPDSVFRASVDYYMDHPKEMEMIYAVLIDSLQLQEQRVPRDYDQ